jgi:mycothiol synthase
MASMLAIDQARPDEWAAALELAYRRLPDERRRFQIIQARHLIDEGAIDPQGIWVARQGQGLAGVQVVVPLGGANFLFWLPETQGRGKPNLLEDALVQAALAWCGQQGAKLAHAILHPADAERGAALVRSGFERTTQLLYLGHDLRTLPTEPATARFEAYSDANAGCFRQTLARSYDGTLDCPELNGVRTIEEILAGYRAAGPFRPDRWWLIRAGDEPAGVVILTELPEGPTWDLSYLGIVPEHRRKGLAHSATCRALHATRNADAVELILAVDERNVPARGLYKALGFVESEVRDVYLHFIHRKPP